MLAPLVTSVSSALLVSIRSACLLSSTVGFRSWGTKVVLSLDFQKLTVSTNCEFSLRRGMLTGWGLGQEE